MTLSLARFTDINCVTLHLISVSNVDEKEEIAFWKMKGKFYFDNKDELLAAVLDGWSNAEPMPLKKAFEMQMLSYRELNEIEARIVSTIDRNP